MSYEESAPAIAGAILLQAPPGGPFPLSPRTRASSLNGEKALEGVTPERKDLFQLAANRNSLKKITQKT